MSNQLFTQEEIRVIRGLQAEFPLVPEPYKHIAEQLGMGEERLLEIIAGLQERGCLKRLSIALRHNNVGYTINVMLVWDVPQERLAEVGKAFPGTKKQSGIFRSQTADKPYPKI